MLWKGISAAHGMRAAGEKQCESFLIAGFSHGFHMAIGLLRLADGDQRRAQHRADGVLAVGDAGVQVVVNHQLYVGDCLGVGGFAHRVFGVVGDADIQPGVALQRVDEGAHRAVTVAAELYRCAVVVQGRLQMVVLSLAAQGVVVEMERAVVQVARFKEGDDVLAGEFFLCALAEE